MVLSLEGNHRGTAPTAPIRRIRMSTSPNDDLDARDSDATRELLEEAHSSGYANRARPREPQLPNV